MKSLKPTYIVFLFPAIIYLNTAWNKYSFDDNFVTNNETVKKGWRAIPEIFTSYYYQENENTFGYRPVVRSLFAAEYAIFGESPATSHLISVLLYAILCLVIFRFISKLFPELKQEIVLLIVILFASHPIHTEVVASLKNREEIIAMLLGILSLSFYLKYLDSNRLIYLLSIPFLVFIAVITKENSLTYPFLIPLIYIVRNGIQKKDRKKLIVNIIFTIIVLVAAYIAYILPEMILPDAEKIVFGFENPLHDKYNISSRIYHTGISLWFYLKILVVPFPLRFYYGYNMFPDDAMNYFLSGTTILITISALLYSVYRLKSRIQESFFILFYLISISVFTNYFIPINGITGERLAFQASLGFCGFVILLTSRFAESKKDIRVWKRSKTVLYIIIAIFSLMTIKRNSEWKDVESILESDIEKLDNSAKGQVVYASWNFGNIMQKTSEGKYVNPGAIDKVLKHYYNSVRIYPLYYSSFNNIGTIFLHFKNKPDSALKYFRKAVLIRPDYTEALYNCGNSFMILGKNDSARVYLEKTVNTDSSFSKAWLKLSDLCLISGDSSGAFLNATKALESDTISDAPFISLGNIFLLKHDTSSAVKYWEKAIERNPRNPNLLYGLGKYFNQIKDIERSEKYLKLYQIYKK